MITCTLRYEIDPDQVAALATHDLSFTGPVLDGATPTKVVAA